MTKVYYNVAPRYTPGSPAMVPEETARKVAREELGAYEWVTDKSEGLAWIVWAQWEQGNTVFRRCLLTEAVRQYVAGKPIFRVKAGPLAGALVQAVRRSTRSGTFTMALVGAHKAYKVGDHVHLMPYEVEETRL